MRLFILAIAIVVVIIPGSARAGQDSAQAVSLNSLIEEALKSNPRILAAHQRALAAKARSNFFRSLPDPELEYEYDRITPSMTTSDGSKIVPFKTLSVSQDIPFPTKLFLKKKAARQEAAALDEEFEETKRMIVKEVKAAYYDLFLSRRRTALTKDSLGLMKQLVATLDASYAVNKARQQDVLKAQVEATKMQNDRILFEQEERIASALLVSLLGREDDIKIGNIDANLSDVEILKEAEVIRLTKENRPELKSFRNMLEKARLERSLSKQEFLPDITLKYKRQEKDGSFREGEWAGSVGVNVPLWFWGKQASQVTEARANFEAAKADYSAEETSVVFEAKSALAKYEAARGMAQLYEAGILPRTASVVSAARRGYETGIGSLEDLLDALKMQRQLEMEYAQTLASALTALADLERVVGSDLGQ